MAKKQTSTGRLSIKDFTLRYAAAVQDEKYDHTSGPFRPHYSKPIIVAQGPKGPVTARYLRVVGETVEYYAEPVPDSTPISFLSLATARGYSKAEIDTMIRQTRKGAFVTGHLPELVKGAGKAAAVTASPLKAEW